MGYRRALAGRRTGDGPHCQYAPDNRRSDMTGMYRRLGAPLAGLLVAGGWTASAPLAHADPEPVMHHVKYAVTAENPIYTDIYYLDHQPAKFSDYSHNPYSFTPHVDVDLGPNKPWTFDLDMTDPDHYAMVVAS